MRILVAVLWISLSLSLLPTLGSTMPLFILQEQDLCPEEPIVIENVSQPKPIIVHCALGTSSLSHNFFEFLSKTIHDAFSDSHCQTKEGLTNQVFRAS